MIPYLSPESGISQQVRTYVEALQRTDFQGDIHTDYATRITHATDNSIYQFMPQAILAPRSEKDIEILTTLLAQPEFRQVALTARGGGTGTNGQSLNHTILIDFSRYLTRIISFNKEKMEVSVQPGVVPDALNDFLRPHGMFFPPHLSPSNRATVGGMVATDACGKGSRVYGKTSDYIVNLEIALANGKSFQTRELKVEDDFLSLQEILESAQQERPNLPKLPRGISGYQLLESLSSDRKINLNKLISGSEGTLALIKNITFRVAPIPKYKSLFVVSYPTVDAALDAVPDILRFNPVAVETLDDKVLQLARGDFLWEHVKKWLPETAVGAVHFVEFVAMEKEVLAEATSAFEAFCRQPYQRANAAQEIADLWHIRKRCVGLLGNVEGARRPIPFIEDTAVPPENLASYIRDLRSLLDRHHLTYGMFGHVDAGCLHVRPALDLRQEQDAQLMRKISDEVALLVARYGGVLWGEHGKGLRAEYVEATLGKNYYALMQRVKKLFDPYNQFNPGKLATPDATQTLLKIDEAPLRASFDRGIEAELEKEFPKAVACNGNGACFNYAPKDAMCPSYKATGDRVHSPKGRAGLLREWIRLLNNNSNKPGIGKDFSHDVFDAMKGCLSCKACTSECPVHVNIPEMKSRFLEKYHTRYRRRVRDYMMASLELLAQYAAKFPHVANPILQNPLARLILRKCGLVDIPRFTKAPGIYMPQVTQPRSVILLQDAFTSFFDSKVIASVRSVLEKLGYQVLVPEFFASGKAQHVLGFRKSFINQIHHNRQVFEKLEALKLPVIGIEPSITLLYRDEYRAHTQSAPLQVFTLAEWLTEEIENHRIEWPKTNIRPAKLFMHCTEKTALPLEARNWLDILRSAGVEAELVATGCCGMAGMYGHEAEHQNESKTLFELSWWQPLQTEDAILVTGYSCRSQIARFSNKKIYHPLQFLDEQFRTA